MSITLDTYGSTTPGAAFVVGAPDATSARMTTALATAGFTVREFSVDEALVHEADDTLPDLLLVRAPGRTAVLPQLAERFGVAGRHPVPIVFGGEDDLDALADPIGSGWDFVVEPFRPQLLRSMAAASTRISVLPDDDAEIRAKDSLAQYEHELQIANEIQSGFLPERLPDVEGWSIAAAFRPAREVGGDFYDVFELAGCRRLGFVVADVCDKGVGAALFMALIRTLVRYTAEHVDARAVADLAGADGEGGADPEAAEPILSRLAAGIEPLFQAVDGTNRYMIRNHLQQGYFATMFFGVLDPGTGTLVYINAGHNPPVVLRADGEHTLLAPTGPAVGILPDGLFSLGQVYLEHGDRMFVYTDGVVEARCPDGGMLGLPAVIERLAGGVAPAAPGGRTGATAAAMVDGVTGLLDDHVDTADQFDDVTMLALAMGGTRS